MLQLLHCRICRPFQLHPFNRVQFPCNNIYYHQLQILDPMHPPLLLTSILSSNAVVSRSLDRMMRFSNVVYHDMKSCYRAL